MSCGKRAFAGEAHAQRMAQRIYRQTSRILRSYRCKCGRWHHTSRPT